MYIWLTVLHRNFVDHRGYIILALSDLRTFQVEKYRRRRDFTQRLTSLILHIIAFITMEVMTAISDDD